MNLFQTIWTALTTENELLINIISVPIMFIEIYTIMLVYLALLNIKCTKQQKLQFVIILSIFGIINRFIIPTPYNVFINFLAIFLALHFIFKASILKSIACLFVPLIISAIIESILTKGYSYILHIDYNTLASIPLHRVISALIVYGCLFIVSFLLKSFRVNFSKLQVMDKKKKLLLVSNILFGIVLIGLQLYMITAYVSNLPFFITFLSLVTLIVYFSISLYTIFTTSQLEETSMKLEEEKLYNKTLQILHDNIRAFKHDFFNIVQGIGGYVGKEDMEGLKEYYAKLLEDCQQTNNLTALSPELVNNPAIYNILATKYHDADELGIKINLEVFMDLNELNINSYELTRILGILINNAIEASKECEEKVINISFRKDKRKHMQIISIENTYMDKDIDTEKIYEKGYSTKEGNTGIGLWEVRQILKKHNNLNLFTTKNDQYFSQQFEIYY